MSKERLEKLKELFGDEFRYGYTNGIAEGVAVAERILVWWSSNERLIQPLPRETLMQWSQGEMITLRAKGTPVKQGT